MSLQGGDKNETSWLGKGFILLLEGIAYLDLSSKENQREANPRYLLRSYQFKGWVACLDQIFILCAVHRVNNTSALTHLKP
jgi:hypothetical protein